MTPSQPQSPFAYRARTADGQSLSGTIDAAGIDEAHHRLQSLQLQVDDLQPVSRSPRPRVVSGEDFLAFNQQLAGLTAAGLPLEQGLRFIAQDMRGGTLKRAIELVLAEVESGRPLSQAIDAHRDQFPALYARLVDAGIRSGNLPGILMDMNRHLSLVRSLHTVIWQTVTYPVIVLITFLAVFGFILIRIVPSFAATFHSFRSQLPLITQLVVALSEIISQPLVWQIGLLAVVALILFSQILRLRARRHGAPGLLLSVPLIGPVLRRSLVARWCDAVGIGVASGMDLPASIELADNAIASPTLAADGQAVIQTLASGQTLASAPPGRILPPMVVSAMELASHRSDLPQTLQTLSRMYRQQAEMRLSSIQVIAAPILLILMGAAVGLLMLALLAPIIGLVSTIS